MICLTLCLKLVLLSGELELTLSRHAQALFSMHLSAHWMAKTLELSRSPALNESRDATRTASGPGNFDKVVAA